MVGPPNHSVRHYDYRAMHFSAKRGIEITMSSVSSVCLSLCLSVCDVGRSGSHKLEVLETNCTTISPTPWLFVAQRPPTYSQSNMGKFWGDYSLEVGWGKVACWRTKGGNISETRKDRWKVTMPILWPIRTHQHSFERYRPRPPTAFPSPRLGVRKFATQLKTAIAIISGTGKATDCKFGRYLHRVHPNKAHEKFERKAWAFPKLLFNN